MLGDLISKALADYEVMLAYNGDEALALATPGRQIDLVITDYLMPSMTGDELIGRLRERRPNVKTLVITGHSDIVRRENDWLNSEVHLRKPFTIPDLRQTVLTLIGPPTFP